MEYRKELKDDLYDIIVENPGWEVDPSTHDENSPGGALMMDGDKWDKLAVEIIDAVTIPASRVSIETHLITGSYGCLFLNTSQGDGCAYEYYGNKHDVIVAQNVLSSFLEQLNKAGYRLSKVSYLACGEI